MLHLLVWIVSGIVAGWLAGMLVRGRGFGLVGIAATSWLGQIAVAALGGVVLVVVVRILRRV